jgi:hypothetical protein
MIVQTPLGEKTPADATKYVTVVKSSRSSVAKGSFIATATKGGDNFLGRLGGRDSPAVEARYELTEERPSNPAPRKVSTPLRINRR